MTTGKSSGRDKADLYSVIVAECFQVWLTLLAKEILLEAVKLVTGSSEICRVTTKYATRAATTRHKALQRKKESIS